MPSYFTPATPKSVKVPCITLIGMPGVGKSTVGLALSKELEWAFVDSDYIIESIYGVPLQEVTDAVTKEEFLDIEMQVIESLRLFRTIIATGGSVVYRESAMQHLRSLGPIIYLRAPLDLILERIARNPQRGIAIAPGQTIEDLFTERSALYKKYAHCILDVNEYNPEECAKAVEHILRTQHLMP